MPLPLLALAAPPAYTALPALIAIGIAYIKKLWNDLLPPKGEDELSDYHQANLSEQQHRTASRIEEVSAEFASVSPKLASLVTNIKSAEEAMNGCASELHKTSDQLQNSCQEMSLLRVEISSSIKVMESSLPKLSELSQQNVIQTQEALDDLERIKKSLKDQEDELRHAHENISNLSHKLADQSLIIQKLMESGASQENVIAQLRPQVARLEYQVSFFRKALENRLPQDILAQLNPPQP